MLWLQRRHAGRFFVDTASGSDNTIDAASGMSSGVAETAGQAALSTGDGRNGVVNGRCPGGGCAAGAGFAGAAEMN